MPQAKHSSDLEENPFGEFDAVRTPASVLDSFKVADEVSPPVLAHAFVIVIVGAEHV